MISEGEKKYLEHAIELAEYIDQQNMTGNLKSEILDKMLIPYGLSDERKTGQQNGNSNPVKNEQKPASPEQPKNQPAQLQKPSDPKYGWKSEVLRLLNEFPQSLERKSQSKIKIVKEIPRSDWNGVKNGFEKEGWKYDWKEKAFVLSEEMRA